MPNLTIHKLLLFICIAGIAAIAVSFGNAEKTSVLAPETETSAPQMCSASIRAVAPPVRKYRSRYLAHTGVSYISTRSRETAD